MNVPTDNPMDKQNPPITRRPAFQFYPSDWWKDTGLRVCSLVSRGLWIEMMAIMHDGEPYGHLTVQDTPLDVAQLARMVGESPRLVAKCLKELGEHKVFSRTDLGVIYSRRMVRDEHLRNVRAAAGKLGGNPALKEGAKDNPKVGGLVNHQLKQKPTPSSAVAVVVSELQLPLVRQKPRTGTEKYVQDFNGLWARYPKRAGSNPREAALKAYSARRKAKVTAEDLAAGLDRYIAFCTATRKPGTEFVMQGSKFFGSSGQWAEAWTIPPPSPHGWQKPDPSPTNRSTEAPAPKSALCPFCHATPGVTERGRPGVVHETTCHLHDATIRAEADHAA